MGWKPDNATHTDALVALAGNPNVGKSTIFNALTGLRQHTGNWPGKTVSNARGVYSREGRRYALMDLPGCYSLAARSAEEEVARNFVCFGGHDAVVVVCDAACLERNLILALQTLELTGNVVVCVNLMDEAEKRRIHIDLASLSAGLGAPVVGTAARSKRGLEALTRHVADACQDPVRFAKSPVIYPAYIEDAVAALAPALTQAGSTLPARWLALRLLENDASSLISLWMHSGINLRADEDVQAQLRAQREQLEKSGVTPQQLCDDISSSMVHAAEALCRDVVRIQNPAYAERDRRIDRLLTSRRTGFPAMFLALVAVLWLTVAGSNAPSEALGRWLFALEQPLRQLLGWIGAPSWLLEMLCAGAYRVLAWVVAVMLPPMAIFFPLFTLLEDGGYLPRVAFNLDKLFHQCGACGKQALTMCMGLGCNAVGVTGCRIIDSPRERLVAILTNSFMPCNGRFPMLIALFGMFFAGMGAGFGGSAVFLGCALLFSVAVTLAASKLLTRTLLRGETSSFVLELPPYRRPQFGKVLVRSLLDRTLFVLGRAVSVAAPAGLALWCAANFAIDGVSLLTRCAGFLDPFAQLLGMDGFILLAFVLGFPANEIVLPIILMAYTAQSDLRQVGELIAFKDVLVAHGWTWITAANVLLFSLMHWPCSTTCLTVRRETGSLRWTALSMLLPTAFGLISCFVFTLVTSWLF